MNDDFFKKLKEGKVPMHVEVSGTNEESVGVTISSARIIINGEETVLIDETVSVKNSAGRENSEQGGTATLDIYPQDSSVGIVKTEGVGKVLTNSHKPLSLKEIKESEQIEISDSTHKVVVFTYLQHDENQQCINIRFENKSETREKKKNHPHISINMDASGKFIQSRGFNIKIHSEAILNRKNNAVIPEYLYIEDNEFGKKVCIHFSFSEETNEITIDKVSLE